MKIYYARIEVTYHDDTKMIMFTSNTYLDGIADLVSDNVKRLIYESRQPCITINVSIHDEIV